MAIRYLRRGIDAGVYRPSTYVWPKAVVPRCKVCGLRMRSAKHGCKPNARYKARVAQDVEKGE